MEVQAKPTQVYYTNDSYNINECEYPHEEGFLRIKTSDTNLNNAGRWFYAYKPGGPQIKKAGSFAIFCDVAQSFGLGTKPLRDIIGAYYAHVNHKRQIQQSETFRDIVGIPQPPLKNITNLPPAASVTTTTTTTATPPRYIAPKPTCKYTGSHLSCVNCHQHVGVKTVYNHPSARVKLISHLVSSAISPHSPFNPKKRKTEASPHKQNDDFNKQVCAVMLEASQMSQKQSVALNHLTDTLQAVSKRRVVYENDVQHLRLAVSAQLKLLEDLNRNIVNLVEALKK